MLLFVIVGGSRGLLLLVVTVAGKAKRGKEQMKREREKEQRWRATEGRGQVRERGARKTMERKRSVDTRKYGRENSFWGFRTTTVLFCLFFFFYFLFMFFFGRGKKQQKKIVIKEQSFS